MKKTLLFIVAMLTMVITVFAYSWKTVYIANETMVVSDTVAKAWIGKLYQTKVYTIPQDTITFYIEGSDSVALDVKLLTYTVSGMHADTITVGTKAAGTLYTTVKILESSIPTHIFTMKPLISITNSYANKTKPVSFKTVMIYKEIQ